MNFWSNIKFTARLFVNNLSTSVMAVLVLAAGIGISVTMFALVNGFLWSSPNVSKTTDILHLEWLNETGARNVPEKININDYFEMRAENHSFSELVAYQWQEFQIDHPKQRYATLYYGINVTDNFFSLFDVQPLLGELPLQLNVKQQEKNIVISFDVWQQEFSASPDILGKLIQLNGRPHRVAAIMPQGFVFPVNQHLWVVNDFEWLKNRSRINHGSVEVLGVLTPNASIEQAEFEFNKIAEQLKKRFPESNEHLTRVDIKDFKDEMAGKWLIDTLTMVLIFSFLVLAIACINVSNLVMARVAIRQHELAIRKSLGANKTSIFSQVMLDALFISSLGALIGLLIAHWGARYIWDSIYTAYGQFIPYWWHINIDIDVVVFTVLITMLCAVLSSVWPAVKVLLNNTSDILKDNSRTSSGLAISQFAKLMVALQILTATVLLCTALTRIMITANETARELTFDPDKVLIARIQAGGKAGLKTTKSVYQFYQEFVARIQALPGVNHVALSFNLPAVASSVKTFEIEGRAASTEQEKIRTSVPIVGHDYFDLLNVKTLQGRTFQATDIEGNQPVAVVNQYFVDKYFPNQSPLGQRVRVLEPGNFREGQNSARESAYSDWLTIVGVVSNYQGGNLALSQGEQALTEVYMPYKQWLSRGQWLLVKGKGDVNRYGKEIKKILANVAPLMSVRDGYSTITKQLNRDFVFEKLLRNIMVIFGVTALLMAAIGLYGLVSFATQLKYREFGIRMALGASAKQVLLLVVAQNKWQISLGVSLGSCAAYATNNVMISVMAAPDAAASIMKYGVIALPIGVLLVIIVTTFATLVPAWKATKVPPNSALRSE